MTGEPHPELQDKPVLRAECKPAWNAFLALHRQRGIGMAPQPISFRDMEAYQRVTGDRLMPWEVRAVQAMDAVALGGGE